MLISALNRDASQVILIIWQQNRRHYIFHTKGAPDEYPWHHQYLSHHPSDYVHGNQSLFKQRRHNRKKLAEAHFRWSANILLHHHGHRTRCSCTLHHQSVLVVNKEWNVRLRANSRHMLLVNYMWRFLFFLAHEARISQMLIVGARYYPPHTSVGKIERKKYLREQHGMTYDQYRALPDIERWQVV